MAAFTWTRLNALIETNWAVCKELELFKSFYDLIKGGTFVM